jgi:secreted trypsin-like serine protease
MGTTATQFAVLCAGLASLLACNRETTEGSVGSTEANIVRGTEDLGHPSVVGVIARYPKNGYMARTACTGTYIAPRVVLTAAHCIPANTFLTRVYYGSDLKGAYENLLQNFPYSIPDGEPWAHVEAVKIHPSYTPSTYYADIAMLLLDRELPVPVTPIARWRLESKDIGTVGTQVGFGATSSDRWLTQVEGWGTKRMGLSSFLGSPISGMETDHPGLGLPYVRDSLAMFDGTAPNSNTCAGDSGGPILMNHGSKEYVYGVSSWTGFYCEDYSFYTRLDPFTAFIDGAIARAGRGPVEPTLECVRPLEAGGVRAYFGYDNANDVSVSIGYGADNRMPADTLELRPARFAPGEHHFAALADYSAGESVFWKLKAPTGHSSVLSAEAIAPLCEPNDLHTVAADACVSRIQARCGETLDYCVADWMWYVLPGDVCSSQFVDYLKCSATLTPDQYTCMDDVGYDLTDVCSDSMMALYDCWMSNW